MSCYVLSVPETWLCWMGSKITKATTPQKMTISIISLKKRPIL